MRFYNGGITYQDAMAMPYAELYNYYNEARRITRLEEAEARKNKG